ncbi:MAG: polysaccharide deacetylase family protein [Terriglobia bacterium]
MNGRKEIFNHMTTVSKRWVKSFLMASGGVELAGRFTPSAGLILMYHAVEDDPRAVAHTLGRNALSTALFSQQMEVVARRFTPLSLDDLLRRLAWGEPLPRKAVVVTFDDGYADNCEIALPVLERFGIPATFYVLAGAVASGRAPWFVRLRYAFSTTRKPVWRDEPRARTYSLEEDENRRTTFLESCVQCARLDGAAREEFTASVERQLEAPLVGDRLMMTWSQVRKLIEKGHTVGSHTMTHPNLAYIGEQDARWELKESKRTLEANLGAAIKHFSYPHPVLNPNWTEATQQLCRQAGFESAVVTLNGPVRPGEDFQALPRLYTPADLSDFRWHLERTMFQRKPILSPSYGS